MKTRKERLHALESVLAPTERYTPPVVVDVVGLSTAAAAERIAAAEATLQPGPGVRLVVIDCSALKGADDAISA